MSLEFAFPYMGGLQKLEAKMSIQDLKIKHVEIENGDTVSIVENVQGNKGDIDKAFKSLYEEEEAKLKITSMHYATLPYLAMALEEIQNLRKDVDELKAKKT